MPYSARSFARMVMPTLVRHDWTADKIVGYLVDKGWDYNRITLRSDLREFQNAFSFGRQLMAYPSDKRPIRSVIDEIEFSAQRKYRVMGRAKVRDAETGKLSYPYKSFYTDTLDSKAALGDEFQSWYNDKVTYEQLEDFDVLYIGHKQGWQY
jgi:hypothetical protein